MSYKAAPLYTLNNSSLQIQKSIASDDSSFEEISEIDNEVSTMTALQQQLNRTNAELQSIKKTNNTLKLRNKELQDNLQIAHSQLQTHQQKQSQLIKSLAGLQVENKQLQFLINAKQVQVERARGEHHVADQYHSQMQKQILKGQEQRALFIQAFTKIADVISKCQRVEDFTSCVGKFVDFIRKNIKSYQQHSDKDFDFEIKFQVPVSSLKERNAEFEIMVKKLKQDVDKQREEKKRVINLFNEKVGKLKSQCDELKQKVEQGEKEKMYEIVSLKKSISEKNQLISELRHHMESEKRKQSLRKSRGKKKSYYISDGERQGDLQMNQLESQIEHLEKLLIEELRD